MDIFEIPLSDCKVQINTLPPARREFGSRACTQILSGTMKPWGELFADNNDDTDKMTLQEMQLSLRKAKRRSLSKGQQCNGSGFSPNAEDETPSVVLELLWEDSTSNGSDNVSFGKAVSSVCQKSQGHLHEEGAQISKASDATNFRSSQSQTVLETEGVDNDDDDWTLQKWQHLLKQGSHRKRLKKLCNSKQEISKSMDDACSIAQYSAALNTCISHTTTSDTERTHSESIEVTQSAMACTTSQGSYEPARRVCQPGEPEPSCSNQGPSLDGAAQGDSLQPLSSVRLERKDESELTTPSIFLPERLHMTSNVAWPLKPRRKVQPTSTSKLVLASSHGRAGKRSTLGTPYIKASCLSGIVSSGSHSTLAWQRKQSLLAASGDDIPGPKELKTTTVMDGSEGVCKSKAVMSETISQINADQSCSSGSTSIFSKLMEGATPIEQLVGTKLPEQAHSCRSSDVSSTLDCNESLEVEEEQEPQQMPAKIPCKRKAISPTLQEFLLKASKLGNCGINAESKGLKGSIHLLESKRSSAAISFGQQGQRQGGLQGSGFYRKPNEAFSEPLNITASSLTPAKNCVAEAAIASSPELHNSNKAASTAPVTSNPPAPPKGILRSSSQSCQCPCNCEECESLRSRAERASEFSQRQMQDIEGLAVKLIKDLSTLRNIVEDRLTQSSSKHQGARSNLSLDQLRKATGNAQQTEETARRWLVRMARDCNRYCKIMRMQGRKLTFSDESGGKLCDVKVFHSDPVLDAPSGVNGWPSEVNSCTTSTQSESSIEAA